MKIKFFHFLAPVGDGVTIWAGARTGWHVDTMPGMRRWGGEEVCSWSGQMSNDQAWGVLWHQGDPDSCPVFSVHLGDSALGLTLPLSIKCVLLHAKLAARPILHGQFIFLTSGRVWQSKDAVTPCGHQSLVTLIMCIVRCHPSTWPAYL